MKNWKKHRWPIILLLVLVGYSCASIGSPDGGPYDEMPPKFVGSSPRLHAVNVKDKKIELEFDEFIKLEKPSEKVVVSPPQLEQPEIKVSGKKVVAQLFDTLKHATTYTIDFSDAIVDNNEGNPMGNFTYSFSTGESIDTMEVSGTVLNAADLEPIKGMLVGLHRNLNDSAFTSLPFDRVSRTDSRGHFVIRGIAPGEYRIYALMDGNQNYLFDSKTEMLAFGDSIIVPSMLPSVRQDTIWKDSLIVDTIKTVNYTRFLPDNIILKAFKEENDRQYLSRSQRDKENHFILKFSAKADTLPVLKGLNFDEKDAFIVEANAGNDSICYWIKDSLVYQMDTLAIQMDYLFTDDSLNVLVPKTDTIYLANKQTREQREKMKKQAEEEKEKERKKREKKGLQSEKEKTTFLAMKVNAPSTFDINQNVQLSFDEPVARVDSSSIHVSVKRDSTWIETPFLFRADSVLPRQYEILAEWQPGNEYQLKIDSAGIVGIYGLHTDKVEQTFKVKQLEEYGTILLNVLGAPETGVVELMDNGGNVLRQQPLVNGTADFFFLKPDAKYYIRMFNDRNRNGVWDTGNFAEGMQAEEVYYFPKVWEMKANFEFEESWNVHAVPVDKQKLDEIKKQKPEQERSVRKRNEERARKLGR